MPPKNTRKGKGALQVQMEQEDSSSHVPTNLPNPPTTQTNIPPPPMDAFKQCMDWWAQHGTHFTQNVPPQNPPPNPSPPIEVEVEEEQPPRREEQVVTPTKDLSKLIKEARLLGCENFAGVYDATVAREWIERVKDTFRDMKLDDESKMLVVVRLLEKGAKTWWENLKRSTSTPITWGTFLTEFDRKYYSRYYRDQKRREFYNLKQWGKTVTEYETELRELSLFVPEMTYDEEALCAKFEAGLNLTIREKMSITDSCTYKDVLQLALRAESMTLERGKVRENQRKRNLGDNQNQGSKRTRSMGSFSGNMSMGSSVGALQGHQASKASISAPSVTSGVRPSWSNSNRGVCANCKRAHVGPCNEPVRCFHCQQVGHLKRNCPRLTREGVDRRGSFGQSVFPRATQARDMTPFNQPKPKTPTGSNIVGPSLSRPQPQVQTRIYAMTQDDAHQNPKTIEGNP